MKQITRCLIACTTFSAITLSIQTSTGHVLAPLWIAWASMAAVTAGMVVTDRRG